MRKRYLALILAATMGFSMVACTKTPNEPETERTAQEKEADTKASIKKEDSEKLITEAAEEKAVPTPFIEITHLDYDAGENDTYFSGSYDVAEVVGDDYSELSDGIASWFSDFILNYENEATATVNSAKNDKEIYGEDFMAYAMDSCLAVSRLDNRITSFRKSVYSYTGGVHGNSCVNGLTFDTKTGKEISFEDLGDIKEDVRTYVDQVVEEKRAEGYLLEMYEDTIDMIMEYPSWYLTGAGLVMVFNPYDIASYAEGRTVVTIPYDKMENFNKQYLPEGDAMLVPLQEGEPVEIDVDLDGTKELIETSADFDENYEMTLNLMIDGNAFAIGKAAMSKNVYFVRTDTGNAYVLASYVDMSSEYVTELIEVTNKEAEKLDVMKDAWLLSMSNSKIGVKLVSVGEYKLVTFVNGKFE